jgi:hypothetical protein
LLWNFEQGLSDCKKAGLLSDVPVPMESRVPVQKGSDRKKLKGDLGRRSNLEIVFPNTMASHEPIELAGGDLGFFSGQINFSFVSFQEVF